MATPHDVRRIALSLPGAREEADRFAFSVANKGKQRGFVWVWLERIDPKKARVPQPKVIAMRVSGPDEKEALLASDSDKFFTEPHYNGYPAVMVRLPNVTVAELRELITAAYACQAPARTSASPKPKSKPKPKPKPKSKPKAKKR